MVAVAVLAASAEGDPSAVKRTATRRPTRFAASSGNRS
jgi:hypothetical protein